MTSSNDLEFNPLYPPFVQRVEALVTGRTLFLTTRISQLEDRIELLEAMLEAERVRSRDMV